VFLYEVTCQWSLDSKAAIIQLLPPVGENCFYVDIQELNCRLLDKNNLKNQLTAQWIGCTVLWDTLTNEGCIYAALITTCLQAAFW